MEVNNCLSNLVGVRYLNCDAEEVRTSANGLYINDLSGISIRNADAATDAEHKTGIQLLQDKLDQAAREMTADVLANVGVTVKGNSILSLGQAGNYSSDSPQTLSKSASKLRGVMFRVATSDFVELSIENIDIHSTEDVEGVEFAFYDLLTGEKLWSESKDIVTGNNQIFLNKNFILQNHTNYFAFTYESKFDALKTQLSSSSGCCQRRMTCGDGVYYEGIEFTAADPITLANKTQTQATNGLRIWFDVACSQETLLCRNAKHFQFPLYYKAASLIMSEMKHSTRLNSVINSYQSDWETLQDEYEEKYRGALSSVLRTVNYKGSKCFSCRSPINSKVRVP